MMIAHDLVAATEKRVDDALATYRGKIALACSFGGPAGMVLIDMLAKRDANIPVYYLDTGLLFPETYALIDRVRERYTITPIAVRPQRTVDEQAAAFGDALWSRDPDACCAMRKVEPQRAFLRGFDAWFTGLRNDGGTRTTIEPITPPDRAMRESEPVRIAPLADWSSRDVWAYVMRNDVPYNVLNDRGYPSVGCVPCTRAIATGEDPRAGRWPGFSKTECGIHEPSR